MYCPRPESSPKREHVDRRPRKPPTGPLARVRTFFAEDIWRPDADALGFPLAPLYRVLRVVQLAARGIVVHRATTAASALAYTTVLSLVPLLAFAFSIAKGVGAYERLRNAVIEPFLDANLGAPRRRSRSGPCARPSSASSNSSPTPMSPVSGPSVWSSSSTRSSAY